MRGPRGDGALVVDPAQVAAGHVSHADGAGRAVQELGAILVDGVVELCNTLVRPVFAQLWKNLSQSVRLGYRPVSVGNGDLVVPVPQVTGRGRAAGALILGCD